MTPDGLHAELVEAAGLTSLEERIYRALVGVPAADAAALASSAGNDEDEVIEALEGLLAKGLVTCDPEPDPSYLAVPPDVALEPLIAEREAGCARPGGR